MANVKDEIRDRLTSDEAICALVEDRVYLSPPAESADKPYIVVTVTASQRMQSQDGLEGLTVYALEIAALAATPSVAATLAGLIVPRISGWSLGGVQSVYIDNEYDAPSMDEAQTLYGVVQTYTVVYQD